jgi:hypothetical protein
MGKVMEINFALLNIVKNPKPAQLKAHYLQYLDTLKAPTVIDITGKDTSRCRVVTTLLHGNEPSGLIALHKWLSQEGALPQTNMRFIICSVEAAKLLPHFSHRYLDNGIDINRCFGTKFKTGYYQRARLIAQAIEDVSPELVVDLHNTSGSGPAFAVCTEITESALEIIPLFCKNVIVSGIKLGALMEQNFNCPVITIECGGAQDRQAHQVAFQGIKQLAEIKEINQLVKQKVNIIRQPMRLKLKPEICLSYALSNQCNTGVTLISSIEQTNFYGAKKGQSLGWLDALGLENFELINDEKINVIHDYFIAKDNQFICKQDMKIFMATSNKDIAKTDCLFYIVKASSSRLMA